MKIARRILSFALFLPTLIPAAPESIPADTRLLPASLSSAPAYGERIVVVPEPEDRPQAVKGKWKRFEEALGEQVTP